MKSFGLIVNVKRLFMYFLMLVLGLSLLVHSILLFYQDQNRFDQSIPDAVIIQRAKALGMIEIKEQIKGDEDDKTE